MTKNIIKNMEIYTANTITVIISAENAQTDAKPNVILVAEEAEATVREVDNRADNDKRYKPST